LEGNHAYKGRNSPELNASNNQGSNARLSLGQKGNTSHSAKCNVVNRPVNRRLVKVEIAGVIAVAVMLAAQDPEVNAAAEADVLTGTDFN
jgi:hypothetical protein